MFRNSAFWQKKVRDFSFNSGVYLMCELEASNNTERSNKIETLELGHLYGLRSAAESVGTTLLSVPWF